MELLTLEQFSGCLNETFRTSIGGMAVDFVLVEASPIPQRSKDAARAPFSLLFLNTAPVLFPQQIYPMSHPRLGEIGIFVTPIAQNRDGFVYPAVFN
jgi:hypothetical protein